MKALGALLACTIILPVIACGAFPEATFQLSPDSRLPRWFSLPPAIDRSQVAVRMDYDAAPWGRKAKLTMSGPDKRVLAEITGNLRGGKPMNSRGEPTLGYPSYEVIEAIGVADIVEHRQMEPRFWMTDDASVWQALAPKK